MCNAPVELIFYTVHAKLLNFFPYSFPFVSIMLNCFHFESSKVLRKVDPHFTQVLLPAADLSRLVAPTGHLSMCWTLKSRNAVLGKGHVLANEVIESLVNYTRCLIDKLTKTLKCQGLQIHLANNLYHRQIWRCGYNPVQHIQCGSNPV